MVFKKALRDRNKFMQRFFAKVFMQIVITGIG